MRTARRLLLVASSVTLLAGPLPAYERLQGPTEAALLGQGPRPTTATRCSRVGGTSYLIDMEGQVVNTWRIGTNAAVAGQRQSARRHQGRPQRVSRVSGNSIGTATSSGNTIEKRDGYAPHHDWVRIFNKKLGAYTTLYIANKSISHEQAIAAGADPRRGPVRRRPDGRDRRSRHGGQRRLGMVVLRPRRPGRRSRPGQLRRPRARRSPTIPAGSTSTCPATR